MKPEKKCECLMISSEVKYHASLLTSRPGFILFYFIFSILRALSNNLFCKL